MPAHRNNPLPCSEQAASKGARWWGQPGPEHAGGARGGPAFCRVQACGQSPLTLMICLSV